MIYRFKSTNRDIHLSCFFFKVFPNSLCILVISSGNIFQVLSYYKNLLFQEMMFYWIFPNHPCILMDKQLFVTLKFISITYTKSVSISKSFFTPSSNSFSQFLLQLKHLIINESSLTVIYSREHLHFLNFSFWSPPARLSTRSDNESSTDIALWMNFICRFWLLISFPFFIYFFFFFFSFFISTEKVMYFFVFSLNPEMVFQTPLPALKW